MTRFAYPKRWLKLAALTALLTLTSCATVEDKNALAPVHLTPEDSVALPSFFIEKDFVRQQLLNVTYGENAGSVLTVLEGQGSTLKLSVLSTLGIRLLDALYSDGTLKVTRYLDIDKLPPVEQVLFDILLTLTSKEELSAVLPQGFSVQDTAAERVLLDEKGTPVERVTFRREGSERVATAIEHLRFNYRITLEELP